MNSLLKPAIPLAIGKRVSPVVWPSRPSRHLAHRPGEHPEDPQPSEPKHRVLPRRASKPQPPPAWGIPGAPRVPTHAPHVAPTGLLNVSGHSKRIMLVLDVNNHYVSTQGLLWALENVYGPGDSIRIVQIIAHLERESAAASAMDPGGHRVRERLDGAVITHNEQQLEDDLKRIMKQCGANFDFDSVRETEWEGPEGVARRVNSEASSWNATALLVPRVRSGALSDQFLGAVAEHCAARALCPVILLHERELGLPAAQPRTLTITESTVLPGKPPSLTKKTPPRARTILIAVDIRSPRHAEKALKFTLDNLYRREDRLRLAHVIVSSSHSVLRHSAHDPSSITSESVLLPTADASVAEQQEQAATKRLIERYLSRILQANGIESRNYEIDLLSEQAERSTGSVGAAIGELAEHLDAAMVVLSAFHLADAEQYLGGSVSRWVGHFGSSAAVIVH